MFSKPFSPSPLSEPLLNRDKEAEERKELEKRERKRKRDCENDQILWFSSPALSLSAEIAKQFTIILHINLSQATVGYHL